MVAGVVRFRIAIASAKRGWLVVCNDEVRK